MDSTQMVPSNGCGAVALPTYCYSKATKQEWLEIW